MFPVHDARRNNDAIDAGILIGLAWRAKGYAMARDVAGFTNPQGEVTFYSGLTLKDTSVG